MQLRDHPGYISHLEQVSKLEVDLKFTIPSLFAYLILLARSSSLVIVPSGKMRSHSGDLPDLAFECRSDVCSSSFSPLDPDFDVDLDGAFSSEARACRPSRVIALVKFSLSAAQDRRRKMNRKKRLTYQLETFRYVSGGV